MLSIYFRTGGERTGKPNRRKLNFREIFHLTGYSGNVGRHQEGNLFVWCNYKIHDLCEEDADDIVRDFQDEYQGQYDDEEDFAYQIVEKCYDLPEFAKPISTTNSLSMICSCATTGLMTGLYFGRLKRPFRCG